MSEEQSNKEPKPRSLRYLAVLNYVHEAENLLMETLVEPNSTNILLISKMLQVADLAVLRAEIEQ